MAGLFIGNSVYGGYLVTATFDYAAISIASFASQGRIVLTRESVINHG